MGSNSSSLFIGASIFVTLVILTSLFTDGDPFIALISILGYGILITAGIGFFVIIAYYISKMTISLYESYLYETHEDAIDGEPDFAELFDGDRWEAVMKKKQQMIQDNIKQQPRPRKADDTHFRKDDF